MIVDKKTGQITSGNNTSSTKKPDPIPVDKTEIVQVASGGIIDAYKAIVEICRIFDGDTATIQVKRFLIESILMMDSLIES